MDTDVVVIAIIAQSLHLNEMWVAFGIGKIIRYIAIHVIRNSQMWLQGSVPWKVHMQNVRASLHLSWGVATEITHCQGVHEAMNKQSM